MHINDTFKCAWAVIVSARSMFMVLPCLHICFWPFYIIGALLRSSYFLGRGAATIDDTDIIGGGGDVGILVCSKNSSPLTPTVR